MDIKILSKVADSINPIFDKRTEDAEVVAEVISKVQNLLKGAGDVLFEETGKSLNPSVEYDEKIDAIKVEFGEQTDEVLYELKSRVENELGETAFVTDYLSKETPIFYICFDAETADLFNNE